MARKEDLFNKKTTKQFMLFLVSGGAGTLTNLLISSLVSIYMHPVAAYAVGYGASLFIAYFFNAKLNFKERLSLSQFCKFVISYIPNFVILLSFVFVFINMFGWNKFFVYAFAAALAIPITFILVKLYAFKQKNAGGGGGYVNYHCPLSFTDFANHLLWGVVR